MPDSPKLRSRAWFDNPDNIDMTALYLERYINYGLSLEELRSGKPIIGIAQTGSDLSPCNRHHLVLAGRPHLRTRRHHREYHWRGGKVQGLAAQARSQRHALLVGAQ